jgi:uncharacterized membrane protein
MLILVLGLIIFIGVHIVPTTNFKATLTDRLGAKGYKGAFALASALGLLLIIVGFAQSEIIPIWEPQPIGRSLALSAMPLVFILLASAYLKTNIRRFIKHPMLTALMLWSLLHLGANGDLRSLLLFGALGSYALVDMFITRQQAAQPTPQPILNDVIVVVVGFVATGILAFAHNYFAGVALF